MDLLSVISAVSIFSAAFCLCLGAGSACLGEGYAAASGMRSLAQQPDEAGMISRTMFIALAIIETGSIYSFVVAMILLFANPFWNQALQIVAK